MENFLSLNLPQSLKDALGQMNFEKPTPIQAQALPLGLAGKDILGSAQTGTGKTAAFGIPMIAHLLKSDTASAIIMTPTRELAVQVLKTIKSLLGKCNHIKATLLIGGEPIVRQFKELKFKPRIIVGTPGRINDHLMRNTLNLSAFDFLVLDETDRMLDMGFSPQIDKIISHLPTKRQTLLFSATMPKKIDQMAQKYLSDPVRIAVGESTTPAAGVTQEVVQVSENEKYNSLITELNKREGSIIVFVKTKWSAERISKSLREKDFKADAIHGDLKHTKRERVIADFRNEKYRIMVATDIAARGLDIPHIQHVINYDLPQCPEDYVHRIGRTARAGSTGAALCFVTPSERHKWRAIHDFMNPGSKMAPDKEKQSFQKTSQNRKPFAKKKFSKPPHRKGM